MIGLVISDKFLLVGSWDEKLDEIIVSDVTKIDFLESIGKYLHDEGSLNAILASPLRQAKDFTAFSGQHVVIGLLDDFVGHSVMQLEYDLSKDEHVEYARWRELKKNKPDSQSFYLFGQLYLPSQENIHFCNVPRALVRTLKLSIAEMGGDSKWMGPASSLYLDGLGNVDSAVIHRSGNKYYYLKIHNNRFGMGTVVFSGGVPRVTSTTDFDENDTLISLGLENSNTKGIPIYCPQKLGRQAKNAWELSDFRISVPFENIQVDNAVKNLPYYESNIFTQLITSKAINCSFNIFNNEGITEFLYEEVYPHIDEAEPVIDGSEQKINDQNEEEEDINIGTNKKLPKPSIDEEVGENNKKILTDKPIIETAVAILFIVLSFIGFNYLELQERINNNIFGVSDKFIIEIPGKDSLLVASNKNEPSLDLIKESKAISQSILKLLTETDLNRYNGLTITKSFLSLEYVSGTNPNIENILGLEPSSFTVEATGRDSTIFLWYYSFELPVLNELSTDGVLNKMDLMVQLDTTLTDYNLKYFEQVYTQNQIYGPLLIWVRGKADILQASAIISNLNNSVLLRKFVLFNKSDKPSPRAGFYVSILED